MQILTCAVKQGWMEMHIQMLQHNKQAGATEELFTWDIKASSLLTKTALSSRNSNWTEHILMLSLNFKQSICIELLVKPILHSPFR